MKWYANLELLKKHELGIEAAKPGGATKEGKAKTWKDLERHPRHRPAIR